VVSPSIKTITTLGSLITVGFGMWHLFVPKLWNWYQYIQAQATELVLAVRAINVFFSASLIIFGTTTLIFLYRQPVDVFYLRVQLLAMALLWGLRVVMQLLYPQGAINPALRYGMLGAFLLSFGIFLVASLSVKGNAS
jgi:hypothetical protein